MAGEIAPIPGDTPAQPQPASPDVSYVPGEIAPAIITKSRIWKPGDPDLQPSILGKLTTVFENCGEADQAARRVHVLQCWENRHMDRGYQYLDSDPNGGWKIIAADKKNPQKESNDANLYPTNVMSAQGDIVTGAMCRGTIKVNIVPVESKNPTDNAAAEAANTYCKLWADVNELPEKQRDLYWQSWTDNRVVAWTWTCADAQRFGRNPDGSPRQREVTKVFGVLETKGPMMPDKLADCGYFIVFEEIHYAIARAQYPWMASRIKPAWGAGGEMEFERIARINTRIGVMGKYLTGTSGIQECSMAYCWLRPGMFFDDMWTVDERDWMLRYFPSGVFVVFAGREVCCFWDESMDDHLAMGLTTRGFGQNRRSMGEMDVPIQKRINIWADLWDKTWRKGIPFMAYDDQQYDVEAIVGNESDPGKAIPVTRRTGEPVNATFAMTAQQQPMMGAMEMFQWYVGPLLQAIDGGVPALYGEAEGADNTVGATQIRVQQSLERHGPAFSVGTWVLRQAACQAARLCAENGNGVLTFNVDGEGDYLVDPNVLKGNFKVNPESIVSIPESGAQREAKITAILDFASVNPQAAQLISSPSNAREIIRGFHLDEVLTIDEADWEDGALEDIERLLDGVPLINPEWDQLQQQIDLLTAQNEQAKAAVVQGTAPPDEATVQQGQQVEQQLEQLQQQLQNTPQYKPSVPVAEDESEDHQTIAATLFSWMGKTEGRGLRRKAENEIPVPDQQTSPNWCKWQNVYLFWQAHQKMAAQFAKPQAPPPRIAITGKLSPEQQAQVLQIGAGVSTSPQSLHAPNEVEQEVRAYTPIGEIVHKTRRKL